MSTALTLQQQAEARYARACARVAKGRMVAYAAWQHIAASHRRLGASRRIAGASGSDDDARRASIRARLASGALPRLEGSTWAGLAVGDHRCACCDETIRAREIEYEPRDQGHALYAHVRCFTLWLSESRLAAAAVREAPAAPPSPGSSGQLPSRRRAPAG